MIPVDLIPAMRHYHARHAHSRDLFFFDRYLTRLCLVGLPR